MNNIDISQNSQFQTWAASAAIFRIRYLLLENNVRPQNSSLVLVEQGNNDSFQEPKVKNIYMYINMHVYAYT